MLYTLYGGLSASHAHAEIFQIAVNHHDAVVHNHAQYHNEARQCDSVQWNVHGIHNAYGNECAKRNGDGCDNGASKGEENHHHQYDDGHGDYKVTQEVIYRLAHHLRQVCNAAHLHVFWDIVCTELIQHFVHFLSIGYNVVSGAHFQREQHATVSVVFYVLLAGVIFPPYFGHVAQTDIFVSIAVYNLLCQFLFAPFCWGDVQGDVLLLSCEASAHGRKSLSAQCLHDGGLTDTIGSQSFAVYIEGDLFLHLAVLSHIAHAGHSAQTVCQFVAVLLQFTIAALLALNGDEQGTCIAEVFIDH